MSTSDPPNNNPRFPQELFEKFIDLIEIDSLHDPALWSSSLVSKAWAHHSRKRIFSQVNFTSSARFQKWCRNIAPGPDGASSLVQVLVFSQLGTDVWIHPHVLLEGEQHLASFTNLKGLVVFNLHTSFFKDRALLSRCFRIMGQDLDFVRFHHVKGTPQTLIPFIQQFPATKTLDIEYYNELGDASPEEPVDETTGRFKGSLRLLSIDPERLGVVDSIARLPLEYEGVSLTSNLDFVEPYNRLISACAPTLERLRIIDTRDPLSHWASPVGVSILPFNLGKRSWDLDSWGLTVASCTKLQTVRLGTSRKPGVMLERFIQSINSSNLLDLVFELIWDRYMHDDITSVMDVPAWEPIDDALCTVARRIREGNSERKLSIVLSVVTPQSADLGKAKLGTLFAKFREGGNIGLKYFVDYLPPASPSTVFTREELTVRSLGRILLRYAPFGSGGMKQIRSHDPALSEKVSFCNSVMPPFLWPLAIPMCFFVILWYPELRVYPRFKPYTSYIWLTALREFLPAISENHPPEATTTCPLRE